MSKRIFTKEQIKKLLENKCVANCTEKSITYSKDFKAGAIKLYEQGFSVTEIFRQAGLDPDAIGKGQPKECLRRWRSIFKKKGLEGLDEARGRNGGRKPEAKFQTDQEKIEYLKTEVAYLKAENDFLAKLRAKRAE